MSYHSSASIQLPTWGDWWFTVGKVVLITLGCVAAAIVAIPLVLIAAVLFVPLLVCHGAINNGGTAISMHDQAVADPRRPRNGVGKQCRSCATYIDMGASVCPYCCSDQ